MITRQTIEQADSPQDLFDYAMQLVSERDHITEQLAAERDRFYDFLNLTTKAIAAFEHCRMTTGMWGCVYSTAFKEYTTKYWNPGRAQEIETHK